MELEEKIARFKGVEACVVFQSGFTANAGTVSIILGKEDFILSDELNHASIIDGARLSRAKIKVFRHKDVAHAEELLKEIQHEPGRKLVITDGVFSMDGDIGPVGKLADLCEKYGAIMMVDDAHASRACWDATAAAAWITLAARNAWMCRWARCRRPSARWAAMCAARRDLIDYLYHRARPFLFSTSHPPIGCGECIAAFDILENEPERIERLWANTRYFKSRLSRAGFDIGGHFDSEERDADYADHYWRRAQDDGVHSKALFDARRDGHGHRVSHGARRQGAHSQHHDQRAHTRADGPGARDV